jgi:dihydrofolate reductase
VAELIYAAIASLDGYVNDEQGNFDWAAPDEEVHAFVNDLERPIGTYLYGRRMYETMQVWQTMGGAGDPAVSQDYAEVWRAADKVVFSTSLDEVATPRTRLERAFDPDAVRAWKSSASRDLSIGGATIAATALRAGLVDQVDLLLVPVIVGGGLRAMPDGVRARLDLVDERRFSSGVVHLQHRIRT